MAPEGEPRYGAAATWDPKPPRFKLIRVLVSWVVATAAVEVAAAVTPGLTVHGTFGAFTAAALVAILNALLPPIVAALRIPFTLALGFILVLLVDALMLKIVSDIIPGSITVDTFGTALLASLVMAAASVVLEVIFGADDDDTYTIRVIQRIARRGGRPTPSDTPGIVYLEIDGLALPVLQRAMRDGHVPNLARGSRTAAFLGRVGDGLLLADGSQPGRDPAGLQREHPGLPLGREGDRTADDLFAPGDCAEIEARHATGQGLLIDGGASRGNLLSGEADEVILTVSRMEAEKHANPGYRPSWPTASMSPVRWSCSAGR